MIRRVNTMIGCRVVNGNHYFSLVRHERGVVLSRATNRRWHHSAFTSMDHCHSFSFENRTHSRYRFGGNVGICGPAHNNTELSLSLRSFGYSSALSLPSTLRPSRSISTLISATSVPWPTTTTTAAATTTTLGELCRRVPEMGEESKREGGMVGGSASAVRRS